jgi:DNA-binding MarR family transcriptional regulator
MTDQASLAWLRLARVYQKIDRASTAYLREHGLSHAQFDVLARVARQEGLTQQELADALLVTKGNVCQVLDRMERAGWIVRRPEGRANRVYLTDEGHQLLREALPGQEALLAKLFSLLAPAEQRQLRGLLRKLDHGLGESALLSKQSLEVNRD